MNYEEAVREILEIPKFGRTPDLANIRNYMNMLGHPEKKLRVIHVAGTNGKGSVCAFIESILRTAGYKTGLFTSPHLQKINERIRINGELCSDEALAAAYMQLKSLYEDHPDRLDPLTYFATLYLMSLIIFRDEAPDYCIMETGLGGRLDATNTTIPMLSIITSISMDHTEVLGDSIEKIAAEKAGIIKKGVPLAVIHEEGDGDRAFQVISEKAREMEAPLCEVMPENQGRFRLRYYKEQSEVGRSCENVQNQENFIDFSSITGYYGNDTSRLYTSPYGRENAALSYAAVKMCFPHISEEIIRQGIISTSWPGRMEEVSKGIYVDGAHNPGAVRRIRELLTLENGRRIQDGILLFAVCADKDYRSMIHMLSDLPFREILITRTKGVRAAALKDVEDTFLQRYKGQVSCYESVKKAWEALYAKVNRREAYWGLCVGSLYLVGEIKECLDNEKEKDS